MGGADGTPRLAGHRGREGCATGASLTVTGTPGHGSQPLRTDNALVKAAEVVRRIDEYRPRGPAARGLDPLHRGNRLPPGTGRAAARPRPDRRILRRAPPGRAWRARPTRAPTPPWRPTIMRAGTKLNVIPDRVELEVDIRSLPGWDAADVRAMLDEVLGDLADDVEIDLRFRAAVDDLADRHTAVGRAPAGQPGCSTPGRAPSPT
jgi:acetylornithine deacetylase/succinyl-diaminopimelate desuccinylase-like protein